MRTTLRAVLLLAAPHALAACHTRGGYFDDDPWLALGPGVPDCPSRLRWEAYERGGVPPARTPLPPEAAAPRPRAYVTAESATVPAPRPGAPLPPPAPPRTTPPRGPAANYR